MNAKISKLDYFVLSVIVALAIVTLAGILSFNTENSVFITNQYGHLVKMFGSGIYANDSYFRAPIFIGSDLTMLILVLPLLVVGFVRNVIVRSIKTKLFLASMLAVVLYYAASISFGVTYNSLHLLYIFLFSVTFFSLIQTVRDISAPRLRESQSWNLPTKGIQIFLIISGFALFAAWLPDIIPTIISGTTLPLIEVYTTEITYVIDMGIISPMIFICLYLLKKKDGFGDVILSIILTLCGVMGVMLPVQTLYQMFAGIDIPIPVLVIKVGIFVLLSVFATFFNLKFYRGIREK
jgi:hypothetical protein